MATVKIETYRGYEIEFDTNSGKFLCDIGDTGKEKNSYEAIKKVIDDFKKQNSEFTPIEVFRPKTAFNELVIGKIVGLRKDGRLVIEKNGKQEQLSNYDWRDYYLAEGLNEEPSELKELEKDYIKAQKAFIECRDRYSLILKTKYALTPVLEKLLKTINN